MSEIQDEPKTARAPLTPEELAVRRAKLIEFYKDQVKFLTHQRNYEALITELDELALRSLMARARMAQMQAPPQEEPEATNPAEGKMPNVPTANLETAAESTQPKRKLAKTV